MECEARLSGIEPSINMRTMLSERIMVCWNRIINKIEYQSDIYKKISSKSYGNAQYTVKSLNFRLVRTVLSSTLMSGW
jgi:hypothetical protein